MKRQLCVTVFFALVLVPDWVSACWPPASGPHYAPAYAYYAPAPVYYSPPAYYQPVYLTPCVPVSQPVAAQPKLHPPKIEQSKQSASGDGPKTVVEAPKPTRPPQIEPVRPAANAEAPKPKSTDPVPGAVGVETKPPAVEPKMPAVTFPNLTDPKAPATEPKLPPLVLPGEKTDPKLPSLELPKDGGLKLPSLELPKDTDPKLPSLELPKGDGLPKLPEALGAPAVPVPAPPPDALIPPPGVSVPRTPDTLPPLTLPPDTPISPEVKPTEVKSSPLTGALKVSVFPAAGTVATNGLRKIGFYNHTDRDLSLTIEGKAVKLPAKTYLHAQMPQTFTWKHGDRPPAKETVPADASGLDVVFRD